MEFEVTKAAIVAPGVQEQLGMLEFGQLVNLMNLVARQYVEALRKELSDQGIDIEERIPHSGFGA